MFTLRFDMRAPSWAGPAADLYAAAIDMCAWAETRGAVLAVLSEHHGAEDGHLPAPLTLASAIAARTQSLAILLAAVTIPLWDPIRLAEEMTVLDLISRGRVSGGSLDRELTDRDIEVAFGTIKAGTCGAVRTRAAGAVDGREAIVIEHVIRMARDVAPDWPTSEFDATYRVDIEGDPDIHCVLTLGEAEGHGAGRAAMASTAMRVVNAIPYVVDAPPGMLCSLDIPTTLPRHVFD